MNKNSFSGLQKIVLFFSCVGLFCCTYFIYTELSKRMPSGNAKMVFFQITRGDAMYLQTPRGKEVFWDGGDDLSALRALSRHRLFWDRHLDMWIISHPDSDHYYGGLEVLKRFDIDTLVLNGVMKDDEKYREIFELAEEKGTKIVIANSEFDFIIDGVQIDTLYPFDFVYGSKLAATNNFSLVQRVSYNGVSVLLTGDIEEETEEALLSSGIDLSADVIKVPHHGSTSSSSRSFLQSVNPEKAIFTVGTENKFGHPHSEIIKRYMDLGIEILFSREKDIVIEF